MLKILYRAQSVRPLHCSAADQRVYSFSGDQIWWSIRKPGLDRTKQTGGRRTVLKPRIDFWEQTKYGHGGVAKLWAGLKEDHDSFEKGQLDETEPIERKYAIRAYDKQADSHLMLEERIENFKKFSREYWLNRLNRGYSGNKIQGMYIPTISPREAQKVFGRTFDDFRCVILDVGRIGTMAPKLGRIYKARVTVAVGNGKGIYGVATAMDDISTEAIVQARQQAFHNLQSVQLYEGRTITGPVYHNYYMTYMNIRPQPAGFGIRAHRLLKRIVDVAGIKDIHITVRGTRPTSQMSNINCLLRALQEIENPQERASRTGYHVVRINPQLADKPQIIASPSTHRVSISERSKPYPINKKYMNQKLHADFFNYSYSGLHRKNYVHNRFHNLIRFGRTGSHLTGHMEYYQMPHSIQDIKHGSIPNHFVGMNDLDNGQKQFVFKQLPSIEKTVITGIDTKHPEKVAMADSLGFSRI